MRKYIEENFSEVYTHFKEFQNSKEYKPYWDKCIEAVCDKQLLSHIVFCNDVFCIPPVKTFLTYYKNDFIALTGKSNAELPLFVKKAWVRFGEWSSSLPLRTTDRKVYLFR